MKIGAYLTIEFRSWIDYQTEKAAAILSQLWNLFEEADGLLSLQEHIRKGTTSFEE